MLRSRTRHLVLAGVIVAAALSVSAAPAAATTSCSAGNINVIALTTPTTVCQFTLPKCVTQSISCEYDLNVAVDNDFPRPAGPVTGYVYALTQALAGATCTAQPGGYCSRSVIFTGAPGGSPRAVCAATTTSFSAFFGLRCQATRLT
jgi:hypothetical protein